MKKNADAILILLTLAAMILALAGALLLAPTEKTMGDVQRIFYFHLGSAAAAFVSFTGVLVASVAFLLRRVAVWDNLAVSSAEVGLLFSTFVLLTGPLWARPVWGTWWVWDPRLTSMLILWFLYAGYLVLRQAVPGARGARAGIVDGSIRVRADAERTVPGDRVHDARQWNRLPLRCETFACHARQDAADRVGQAGRGLDNRSTTQ